MKNTATAQLYSLFTIPMRYKRLFGREIDIYNVVELCKDPLRDMGAIVTKKYLFRGSADKNGSIKLPCNPRTIESVATTQTFHYYSLLFNFIDSSEVLFNYRVNPKSRNDDDFDLVANQVEGVEVEVCDKDKIIDRPTGLYVDYVWDEDNIKGIKSGTEIDIIYTKVIRDDNGYLMIPEKAQIALCYYFNMLHVQKEFYKGRMRGDALQLARQDCDRLIAQARTPIALTENEMDDLMNVATSSNRKKYGLDHRQQ